MASRNSVQPDETLATVNSADRDGETGKTVIVKPVVNAVRILRYLSEAGSPARAITIARSLSINASTCFNILRTLALEEVVRFDPLSKTYTPGIGLTRLVENFLTEGQRVAAAVPHMADLAAEFSVTMALWKRVASDRIVLVKNVSSPTDLRIEMAEGQRLPMMMGATGRLFAPRLDLSEKKLRAMFKTLRWRRPLSFEEYWNQVELSERNGWAVDDGYFSNGVKSLAVPIDDRNGNLVFTLVAIMFRDQLDPARLAELGGKMKDIAPRLATILL
ncbi:IclR family transcriptional regulator [Sphingobium naphthae]|uniref:Helix-turn-helix domain-containing protein n=1 Tax=Sphingobium naphthae TaxID=1886786 RepID=A0ABU4A107_9SPHN|nr:IclR family transcriptional regulator C-terminal domain-containing protein [Sphingobium naphthae]MCC4250822.1 helix-turn-helix domain-containing protein [Sphingobium naphthae]MDV5825463.1 helix-turn-helix domain-containing protein [Sphingobium naphthae]